MRTLKEMDQEHQQVARQTVQDAIRAIVAAVRTLGTARGHVFGRRLVEDGDVSIECEICERYVVISLTGADPEITGKALGTCPGRKVHQAVTRDADGLLRAIDPTEVYGA